MLLGVHLFDRPLSGTLKLSGEIREPDWRAGECPEDGVRGYLEIGNFRAELGSATACFGNLFFLDAAAEIRIPEDAGLTAGDLTRIRFVLVRTDPDGQTREYRMHCPAEILAGTMFGVISGSWEDGLCLTAEAYEDEDDL